MAAAAQAAQERPCLPHREAGPFLCLHHMESAALPCGLFCVNSMESTWPPCRASVRPVQRQSHGKRMVERRVPLRPSFAPIPWGAHGRPPRSPAACSAPIAWKVPSAAFPCGLFCANRMESALPSAALPCGLFSANRMESAWPPCRASVRPSFAPIPWGAHGMRNGHSSRGQNMFMDFRSRYLAICAGKQYNEAM